MSDNSSDLERIEALLQRSISASNRTTHAVRSFVGFILIQLGFTTVAAILWNFAQTTVNAANCFARGEDCQPVGFLVLIAAVVFIIGVVVSSSFAWSEFQKSDEESRPGVKSSYSAYPARDKDPKVKCRVCRSALDPDGKCSLDLSHKQF